MNLKYCFFVFAAHATAQTYLDSPEPVFQALMSPAAIGNECAFGPGVNPLIICTGGDGTVTAIQPTSSTPETPAWSYSPEPAGATTSSSGVSFSSSGIGDFLAVSVTVRGFECRVDTLSLTDGSLIWSSPVLLGACSGTPVVSSDGSYLFLTHNIVADNTGVFTILDGLQGDPFYNFTDVQPFSPPAIYHNPLTGNYDGGEGNTNDMVVFASTLYEAETGVSSGAGAFAFQFPIAFQGTPAGLGVASLLNNTDWKAVTPPTITDNGLSMYWGVSRGDVLAWSERSFSREVGGNKISLGRGNPSWQPVNAEIATDKLENLLYSAGAGNRFACVVGSDLSIVWEVETTSPVYAKPLLSPDDSIVYIIEENGIVYAFDAVSGAAKWNAGLTGSRTVASFAQSAAGDVIYFADSTGIMYAWRVAQAPPTAPVAPTTASPTLAPGTEAPATGAPVVPPTMAPVIVSNGTILDIVLAAEPPLSTLVGLVTALDATGLLSSASLEATLFAPSDAAFANSISLDYLSTLTSDPLWVHHLECLISHHLVPAFTNVTSLWQEGEQVDSLSTLSFGATNLTLGTTPASVNGIVINETNYIASNGIVQFLEEQALLAPCVALNILELGLTIPEFSTVFQLLRDTGISGNLELEGPFTLFVPSNAAFEALPSEVSDFLMDPDNLDALRGVLFHHIVRQMIIVNTTDYGSEVYETTNLPESVTVVVSPEVITVDGVLVETANVLAMNGVVHVVKKLLLPGNLGIPVVTEAPVTAMPVTEMPITQAPVTASPVTAAPITQAPVTQAPASSAKSEGVHYVLAIGAACIAFYVL